MFRHVANASFGLMAMVAHVAGAPPAHPTGIQIQTWVKQLDDDSFRIRAAAEGKLKEIGRPAISPLAKVIDHDSVEVRNRTERILKHIVKNAEFETQNEAAVVLARILGKEVVTELRSQWAREWLSEKKIRVNASVAVRGEATAIVLEDVELTDGDATRTATSIELLATNIHSLSIFKSKISSAAMTRIGSLPSVRSLSLRGENVTDDTLASIKAMMALERLSLQDTRVTDAGLSHLKHLKTLEHLDLSGSKISDNGMRAIAQIDSLQTLHINDTVVTKTGIAHLAEMPRLTQVRANRTRITDAALTEFAKIPRLRSLWIKDTRISDPAAATFLKLRSGCHLYR